MLTNNLALVRMKHTVKHLSKQREHLLANLQGGQAAIRHGSKPIREHAQDIVLDECYLQIVLPKLRDDRWKQGNLLGRRLSHFVGLPIVLRNNRYASSKNV